MKISKCDPGCGFVYLFCNIRSSFFDAFQAEETEILMSELAKIVGGERALVEECGDLLSRTYASQVDECSLRGQIIQLHCQLAK